MPGNKKKLTEAQRKRLMELLEEDEENQEENTPEVVEVEEKTSVGQMVVFNGTAEEFIKIFGATPMAAQPDDPHSDTTGDTADDAAGPKDEPQPKSRSRYFRA